MQNKPSNPNVIGVGHLCYDHICIIKNYPSENTSTHIEKIYNQPGGAASQAIATLARLGEKTGYLGCIGDDDVGMFLYDNCKKEGIDVSHVQIIPKGISSTSFVLVNTSNANRTLFSYHDKLPPYKFIQDDEEYISKAKIIHIDGTMYENAYNAAIIARNAKIQVSLDGCSMQEDNLKNLALVELADILIMNETYPTRLIKGSNRENAMLKIATLGPKIVISTSGDQGCLAVLNGTVKSFPAYKIHPIDTTGAGDAFHGAFLFGLLHDYSLEYSINFASAVAAINCMSIGGRNGLPDLDSVKQFMTYYPYI